MATKTKTDAAARTAEEVAQSTVDALKAHDVDAIVANWRDDGVEDIVPLGILRGKDEIGENIRTMFTAAPDLEVTLENIVADDHRAVIQWRGTGTFTGEGFNGIDPTGSRIELRFLELMEIEDGLIARNTVYYDSTAFARQIGMMPAQESGAEKAMITAFNAVTKVRKAIDSRKGTA
jgi:steroid delta-isomerase-like uncharacterized protein